MIVVGVLVGLLLVAGTIVRARRRRVQARLLGWGYDPALPSRLRDPETGELL